MRTLLVLLGTACSLAACSGGGGGAQSIGSIAPPAGTAGSATPTATDVYTQFANPTEAHTYKGLGGSQTYSYTTDGRVVAGQQGQTYAGNATTVRDSGITVTYDPRDAIFTLTVADARSGAKTDTRFQDPANRVNFGGSNEPQWGTPDLSKLPSGALGNPNIAYLQAGDGNPISPYLYSGSGFINAGNNTTPPNGTEGSSYQGTSFFYEKPGSTTKYVTFAGYVRNALSFATITLKAADGTVTTQPQESWTLERGAFAYGAQTVNSAVPATGTGTFTGSVLGSMVYNPTLDSASRLPTYFQWLSGTSAVTVDFGAKTVGLRVDGFVYGPQGDRYTLPSPAQSSVPNGASFSGTGAATIDLVGKGGFTGMFSSFAFTAPGGAVTPVTVAGSSIDGAFFGPAAQEVGGGFRVAGATPDQRIDILGTFTGKK